MLIEHLEDRTLPTAGAFLQGTAFLDANHDHSLDAGDPHLPGAVVSLYQGTGPGKVFLSSTTTDANGAYLFQDNDPNDMPLLTNLTPGMYTLVETPPSGLTADGTQILSQINPATQAGPDTIQVKLVDPTNLSLVTNAINFLNRNAWDFLQETFHFTGAGVTSGSPTVTMSNTNPLAVGEPVTVSDGVTTLSSTIASIVPNNSITLNDPWPGSTGNSATVNSTATETAGQFPVTAGTIQATGATVTSGSNVVGNISDTSSFFIGERVNVSDATAALDSTITGITPNTSITLADTWTDASSNTATILSDVNQPFLTLCWDLQHFLTDRFNNPPLPDTNFFQVLPTSGQGSPANAGRIAYLFNHYATADIANSPAGSPAQAIGLQVAIWELEYDGTFTDLQVLQEAPVNSNNLATELSQVLAWADFYVNDSVGKSETATFLEVNGSIEGGEQGMIATGSLNFGNLGVPTINTSQQPATATVGDTVADKATVSGGFSPTGTVTFNLYNNPNGTGTPLFTDTETLVKGMATSKGYTTTATGTDYWVATYNGDTNNNPVTSGPAMEPVVITPATPSINTWQQPATAIVGSVVADKAKVSGGFHPTGTVTFNLYNNPNGTGTPLFTDTETLVSGVATSQGYTTSATGTDYWVATYNGDSNNNPVTSGPANEPVVITPATPNINTSQQPPSATVGTAVADKATVTGGFHPTGTVTFNLYNNPNGTGTPLFTDTEWLSAGMATSKSYTPTVTGTDYWVATYNGDSNNNSVTSGTALEPVVITPATPNINTSQQPASATVGTSVADKAIVSGGFYPTGTVTFNLYSNPNGTGTPLFTDTETLVNGMATSKGYTTTAAGTDYWVATYNGDRNNNSVTSGTALEPVVIVPATPAINTSQQPASALAGTSIADKATVSGGFYPTGTVTFNLYNNPNGTGTPLFTDTEPLVNGMATSNGFTALVAGTDYWVATYNGDSNNTPVTSGTALEPVVITPAVDVSVSKVVSAPQAVIGTNVTYTFVVYNFGPSTATNVVMTDPLPNPGLSFVSALTPSQGTVSFHPSTFQLTWSVGTLAVNGSAALQIVAQVTSIGPIVNTATVSSAEFDTNLANNVSSVTIIGLQGPGQVSKSSFLSSTPTGPSLAGTGVSDPGFELPAQGSGAGAYAYDPTGSPWTFSGWAGLTGNVSAFTGSNPSAPEGNQVAFLQGTGAISQSVNLAAGSYIFTFDAAQRANWQASFQTIGVYVDNNLVGTIEPQSTSYGAYSVTVFHLPAGNHVLRFAGLDPNGGDNTAFLDNVTMQSTPLNQPFDPGFETPVQGSGPGAFSYAPTGSPWNFTGAAGLTGNGSAFTGSNPGAPQGNQVAFLQGYGSLSQNVSLAGGSYVITFDAAQRANWQASFQTIAVYVDNNLVGTIHPAGTNYVAYSSSGFSVAAGNHVVRITGLDPNGGDNTACLDQVAVQSLGVSQPLDPGFETPGQGSGSGAYTYAPGGSPWTFSSAAGLSGNGSAFTAGNPSAPEGNQVAFLQGNGAISQSVNFTAGSYIITFDAAQRANWQASAQAIDILVDGVVVGNVTPNGTSYGSYSSNRFTATTGKHAIAFVGLNVLGHDNTAFIDQVTISAF